MLKTIIYLPEQRMLSRLGAAMPHRGLLVILLAVMVLAAGCGPVSVAGSWAGLKVEADSLIVANLDHVTRFNNEGIPRWEFPRPSERNASLQFYATPASTEEAVYIGGFDRKVYALDRNSGVQLWVNEDADDHIIGGLAVAQGKVLVGVGSGLVMALNQRTGELEWRFNARQGIWATPLVVGDVVYVTSLDHYLYALDVNTGEALWQTNLEGAAAGTPAYADGVLYVGSFAHKMFAIGAGDGEILNTFETANWVWGGPALAEDGILYFGDLSGFVYALNAATFEPRWQMQIASAAIRATPLVAGDRLVIGSRDDSVYVLNRFNGVRFWTAVTGGDVLSDPVLLGDSTLIVSPLGARTLVAYDLAGGQELWSYPLPTGTPTPPPEGTP